ncbi:MAG: hypothetical protein ABIH89_02115 [Elusimicrobiota bacterium]
MKKDISVYSVIVAVFLIVQIPYIFRGLSGEHRLRQADTAAVARNFFAESSDILKPRIDNRRDKTGITAMEFPVFNYLVSLIYRLTGSAWFGWGQIMSLVFAVGIFFLIYRFSVIMGFRFRYKAVIAVSLLMNDLFFRFSAKFMPETIALFTALSGSIFFIEYAAGRKDTYKILMSWFFLSMSILIRPYMVMLCFPVLVYTFRNIKNKSVEMKGAILGVSILLPFSLWYYFYCPYLVEKYGLEYFYMGSGITDGFFSCLTLDLWSGIIKKILFDLPGFFLLPFFIAGLHYYISNIEKYSYMNRAYMLGVPLSAVIILPVVAADHFIKHPYYLFAAIPSIVIITAIGLDNIAGIWKKFWTIFVLFFIIFIINKTDTYLKDRDLVMLRNFMPVIENESEADDLFMIEGGEDPVYAYFIGRKGWPVKSEIAFDKEKLVKFREENGVRFVLRKEKENNSRFELIKLDGYK